jgi:hypothetical protein
MIGYYSTYMVNDQFMSLNQYFIFILNDQTLFSHHSRQTEYYIGLINNNLDAL